MTYGFSAPETVRTQLTDNVRHNLKFEHQIFYDTVLCFAKMVLDDAEFKKIGMTYGRAAKTVTAACHELCRNLLTEFVAAFGALGGR